MCQREEQNKDGKDGSSNNTVSGMSHEFECFPARQQNTSIRLSVSGVPSILFSIFSSTKYLSSLILEGCYRKTGRPYWWACIVYH